MVAARLLLQALITFVPLPEQYYKPGWNFDKCASK
jgi:hypothetical protein